MHAGAAGVDAGQGCSQGEGRWQPLQLALGAREGYGGHKCQPSTNKACDFHVTLFGEGQLAHCQHEPVFACQNGEKMATHT